LGIWDFRLGFGILDWEFGILDWGFGILDWGFGICDTSKYSYNLRRTPKCYYKTYAEHLNVG
jgi:hypothetical protein